MSIDNPCFSRADIDGCSCGASADQIELKLMSERDELKASEALVRVFGYEIRPGEGPFAVYHCTVCRCVTFTIARTQARRTRPEGM